MKPVLFICSILVLLSSCGKEVKHAPEATESLNVDGIQAQGIYLWANGNGFMSLTGVVCENGVSTNLQKLSHLGSFKQSVALYRPGRVNYVVNGIQVPLDKIGQIVDEAMIVLRSSPPESTSCPKQILAAVYL